MANEINDALGQDKPEEKTSEDSKAKKPGKTKDLPKLNEDILSQMMITGDNEAGMFAPDEKQLEEELEPGEELHEEQDEEAKLGKIKSVETRDEYKKAMAEDLKKHPDKYTIDTPRGRMTVSAAVRQGFNPETGEFEKSLDEKNEEELSRLNEQDRAKVEAFMDPSQVGLAPADADAYGVPEGSPMRKPTTPPMQQPMGPGAPIPGGLQTTPMQATPQAPAPQGADILSMLGGGQ
jgi:hypothetical protein